MRSPISLIGGIVQQLLGLIFQLLSVPVNILTRHRVVLAVPSVRMLFVGAILARLPMGTSALAALLHFSSEGGGYTTAGAVTGSFLVGVSIGGPIFAALSSRIRGERLLLLLCSSLSTLSMFALSRFNADDVVVVIALGFVAGIAMPPITPLVRSKMSMLVPPKLQASIYSLDVTFVEVTFVIAPALVGATVWFIGPTYTLALSGIPGAIGAVLLFFHPVFERASIKNQKGRQSPCQHIVKLRLVLPTMAFAFIALGALEVAIVAVATQESTAAMAGTVFAFAGVGSFLGGIFLGPPLAARGGLWLTLDFFVVALCLGLLASSTGLLAITVALAASSFFFAPAIGCIYVKVGTNRRIKDQLGAFAWMFSCQIGSIAAGNYFGGLTIDKFGIPTVFLAATFSLVLAATLVAATSKHFAVAIS